MYNNNNNYYYYHPSPTFLLVCTFLTVCCVGWFGILWIRHIKARRSIESSASCRLPLVPRGLLGHRGHHGHEGAKHYDAKQEPENAESKRSSSFSTTTPLDRMIQRTVDYQGPYGMYGDIRPFSNTPLIVIAHPVPAQIVLSQARQKSPAYDAFQDTFGQGTFSSDGDVWKAKRTSILHCLIRGMEEERKIPTLVETLVMDSSSPPPPPPPVTTATTSVDHYKNVSSKSASSSLSSSSTSTSTWTKLEWEANSAADDFCQHVLEALSLHDGDEEQKKKKKAILPTNDNDPVEFNVVPILQLSTVNFIYRFITHDGDIQSLKKQNFSSYYTSTAAFFATYLQALVDIRLIIFPKSQSWLFYLSTWAYKLASPIWTYRERETLKPIHEFARIACRNAQPGSPLALLQERPSHGAEGLTTTRFGTASTLPSPNISTNTFHKAMVDEAVTLLFAGQDTSAATLSWTIHLLTLYPEIQEKLATCIQEECMKQYGMHPTTNQSSNTTKLWFTKKFVTSIPYLDAVLKESMRLYPVAPYVIRHLTDNLKIPPEKAKGIEDNASTVILPKGSMALISIYAMQRNPALWHRPDDFIPERWIDPDLKKLDEGQKSGAWMPFAYGPRNCVGQPLAHVVIRVLLARMINEWRLTDKRVNPKDQNLDVSQLRKPMQLGFTVLPLDGVYVSFQRRWIKSS